jgi:hypothetical protein
MTDIRDNPKYQELKTKFLNYEISADEAIEGLSALWIADPWIVLSNWLDEMCA